MGPKAMSTEPLSSTTIDVEGTDVETGTEMRQEEKIADFSETCCAKTIGFLRHLLFTLFLNAPAILLMIAVHKKELSTDIHSDNSCQIDEAWKITGEQSSTIAGLCIKGIDVDGTNIKDCRQLYTIYGWLALTVCGQWLYQLALIFYWRNAVRYAQMLSFLSTSSLLGAILWFALDSPLCTGQGMGLGLSMQIDIGVMIVQFAVLLRSILFDKKLNGTDVEDQNKANFWKNLKKNLDEIYKNLRLQNEMMMRRNIAAEQNLISSRQNYECQKEFIQILMRKNHPR